MDIYRGYISVVVWTLDNPGVNEREPGLEQLTTPVNPEWSAFVLLASYRIVGPYFF